MWIRKPLVLIVLVITVIAIFSSVCAAKTGSADVSLIHKIWEGIQVIFLLWVSMFLVMAFFGGADMMAEVIYSIQLSTFLIIISLVVFVIISSVMWAIFAIVAIILLILRIFGKIPNKRLQSGEGTVPYKKEKRENLLLKAIKEFPVGKMVEGGIQFSLGFVLTLGSSYFMYRIVGHIATFYIAQPVVIYLTPYTAELQSIVSYLAENF